MAYLWVALSLLLASVLVVDASRATLQATSRAQALADDVEISLLGEALTKRLINAIEAPSDDFENILLDGSRSNVTFFDQTVLLGLQSEAGKISLGAGGVELQNRYLKGTVSDVHPVRALPAVPAYDAGDIEKHLAALLTERSYSQIAEDFSRFNPKATIDPAFASDAVLRAAGLSDVDIAEFRAKPTRLSSSFGTRFPFLAPGPPIFKFSVTTVDGNGTPRSYSATLALSSGGRATIVGVNDVEIGRLGSSELSKP